MKGIVKMFRALDKQLAQKARGVYLAKGFNFLKSLPINREAFSVSTPLV
jgi:hypothetical protein